MDIDNHEPLRTIDAEIGSFEANDNPLTDPAADLDAALVELKYLKNLQTELDRLVKRTRAVRERHEYAIFRHMKDHRIGGHKIDGIANFVPQVTIRPQVQDRNLFIEWARENDPGLLTQMENKQGVKGLIRERTDNGEPLPPGLSAYEDEFVSVRAA